MAFDINTPFTPSWTQMKPVAECNRLWWNKARFKVNAAGRRSGKTLRAKRRLVMRAILPWDDSFPNAAKSRDPRYFAAAPTWQQARNIYWFGSPSLKDLIPDYCYAHGNKLRAVSEGEMRISLRSGAIIQVTGLDRPERIEGPPWDGGILDEYGNMKSRTWPQHVRPALSDRTGWCDLIGVPEGRNHYYDTAMIAQEREAVLGTTQEYEDSWAYFHWKSSEVLSQAEIEAAKRDMDELTFLQEYEASFVYFKGRVYYVFDRKIHANTPLTYDPNKPINFDLDFNVEPGVAVVTQEQIMPGQYLEEERQGVIYKEPVIGTGIIGEVYIPRNSNTILVCNRLWNDWHDHNSLIYVYGDATGGARGSAKVQGSDWDLVRSFLAQKFGDRVRYRVKEQNPPERARVNAMNSRLLTLSGLVRMMVDPRCHETIKDFEGTRMVEGGSGEIDKKIDDGKFSHLTDGLGYEIEYKYPVSGAPDRAEVVRI